jgi:tetratricopeptide (TPR) repeat protein
VKSNSKRAATPKARTPLAACALLLLVPAAPPALAQGGGTAQTTTASQQPSQRERRALAYAKLLEGQRHFSAVRGGSANVETLRRAQAAFQAAAEADPTLAEARTALAEVALFFDDLQLSEQEGLAAVRIDPDNLGARRILSRVYTLKSKLVEESLDRGFADKAVAELREVARVRPNDAEAWALLAEFYLATGREKEAIEALTRWTTLPASIEGRFYQVISRGRELSPDAANARLAEVLMRSNRHAEALAAIRRALAIAPDNARYLELFGEALEASGGADQSVLEELRRVVALNPQSAVAISMLARAQARSGRVEEAAETLRAGIRAVKPGNDRDRLNLQLVLAQTLEDASRFEEAVAVYEELLAARNIKNTPLGNDRDRRFASEALSRIISLRRQAGQPDQAHAVVERMRLLLGNADPTAEIHAVDLLLAEGKREEALAAARAARRRFPEETRLLQREANTLVELGRVEEALGLIRPRLRGDASDYGEYLLMASLLLNAGRGTEAVEAARKALNLATAEEPEKTTTALLMLSSAQERAGDAKGSEESLRRILAKDPNNATALNNLGYFLTERNERLSEALEMIERAVRAEPSNPSFLDSLGWVNFKLGKLKEAERYLSDAARRNSTSATIQEHLGDLFQRLGQHEKARVAFRKALSLSVESADTNRIQAKLNGLNNK